MSGTAARHRRGRAVPFQEEESAPWVTLFLHYDSPPGACFVDYESGPGWPGWSYINLEKKVGDAWETVGNAVTVNEPSGSWATDESWWPPGEGQFRANAQAGSLPAQYSNIVEI